MGGMLSYIMILKAIVEYLIIALSHFDTSCKNLTRGIA